MLRETKSSEMKDQLHLFCVVKKVAEDGTVVLRLIVDNRVGNFSWRKPPWVGLAGPGALAELNTSMATEDEEFFARAGDIPNWFYMLEVPEEVTPYFVMKGVSTVELKEKLVREGWEGVFRASRSPADNTLGPN